MKCPVHLSYSFYYFSVKIVNNLEKTASFDEKRRKGTYEGGSFFVVLHPTYTFYL